MKYRANLWVALVVSGGLCLWLGSRQPEAIVLAGFIVLFVILRVLQRVELRDLTAVGLGLMVSFFLLPMGLIAALASFSLVQVLAELRSGGRTYFKDRFREGHQTAQRILDDLV